MSHVEIASVRAVLVDFLLEQVRKGVASEHGELTDDYDLLLSGTIDSLGMLELVGVMQENFGEHIDFDAIDPEQLTVVGPLCRFVAEHASVE